MIIIVESGATKTDWCAAALDKEPINVKTAGMNKDSCWSLCP